MADETPGLRVALHGPNVTIEDVIQAGEATKRLLDTTSEQIGAPTGWQIQSVQFQCDGCGLLRPDRPRPDEGWTYRDGDDFCPTCTASAASQPSAT